jgi:Bacteriophage head to tail connecting protein
MEQARARRDRMLRRKTALWSERSSWDSHWREIAQYQMPRASRFQTSDTNRGDKRHNNVYDNTAIFAHRTLAAGMMSGMTSPARPWFRLGLGDKDLAEHAPVRQWLNDVGEKMRAIFNASNTYNSLHQCYEELGAFGTWADFVMPDFDNVLHHYPMTVGEYALATNDKGYVDTLVRELAMTVGQMVRRFGRENVSVAVRNLYDRDNLDAWVDIIHFVEPRPDRDRTKSDARNMPFKSCYFEPGSDAGKDDVLSESGFKRFPALCPRWVVTGNDIYGRSPGMECLGDVKQLQLEQLRKAQAIDYMVNPPLQVPTQYKDQAHKRLPGGVMFVDATGPGGGVRSAYEVNLNLNHLLEDVRDTRERINSAYYADLFLMLQNDIRSGVTATEIAERHEEKLLMLGPVLERLHNELLSPLIDITFDRMVDADILPPIPEEIAGREINIEFISTLAQAQRAVASSGADRLLGTVTQLAAVKPDIVDKVDFDQVVDEYADLFGVNPKLVVSDEQVAEMRASRAKMAAAQQAGMAVPEMAKAAKEASQIDPQNLRDVMGSLMGYNTPTPGAPL